MKTHLLLAFLLGGLTVSYTALADFDTQPDSIDQIAYIKVDNVQKTSRRFLRPMERGVHTVNADQSPVKRGETALV